MPPIDKTQISFRIIPQVRATTDSIMPSIMTMEVDTPSEPPSNAPSDRPADIFVDNETILQRLFQPTTQTTTMGNQSQNRNGSVKACKKNAVRRNRPPVAHARYRASQGRVFDRFKHCTLCRKRHFEGSEVAAAYKKGHHKLCPEKTENKEKIGKGRQLTLYRSVGNVLAGEAAKETALPLDYGNNVGETHQAIVEETVIFLDIPM